MNSPVKKGDTVFIVHKNGSILSRTVKRVTSAGSIVVRYISGEWFYHPNGTFKPTPKRQNGLGTSLVIPSAEELEDYKAMIQERKKQADADYLRAQENSK